MKFDIPEELIIEKSFVVKKDHLAIHLGSGNVDVLSTPSMILFMEYATRIRIDELLPEGYTTVGTEVSVKHIAAAPKGAQVLIKARLTKKEGKKLLFEVKAWWNKTKLGEGTHERYIINQVKFQNHLSQLKEKQELDSV
ncbi:MAG: thioesterase family protein [Candidatus Hodarchaeales archaeon]|jgi:predicted thioesterase